MKPADQPHRNSFEDAATECGVPVAELKLWLIEHLKVSRDRWSKWEHGKEGIPKTHLIAFMRAKFVPPEVVPITRNQRKGRG